MAAATVALEVLTPRGAVVQAAVDEVVLPGVQGEFGVLPGHVTLLSALNAGLVRYRSGSTWTPVAIRGGFAEVGSGGRVIVLAQAAATAQQVSAAAVDAELAEARAALSAWTGPLGDQQAALEQSVRWAEAQRALTES